MVKIENRLPQGFKQLRHPPKWLSFPCRSKRANCFCKRLLKVRDTAMSSSLTLPSFKPTPQNVAKENWSIISKEGIECEKMLRTTWVALKFTSTNNILWYLTVVKKDTKNILTKESNDNFYMSNCLKITYWLRKSWKCKMFTSTVCFEVRNSPQSNVKIYKVLVARFFRNFALFSTWHKNNSNKQHWSQELDLKCGHVKRLHKLSLLTSGREFTAVINFMNQTYVYPKSVVCWIDQWILLKILKSLYI